MDGRLEIGTDDKVPTHEEVAGVLEKVLPEVAEFVRINEDLCWGDLLFDAQGVFPLSTVAAAIREMAANGWGRYVAMVWCPWSRELAREVLKVRKLRAQKTKRSWLARIMEEETVHGSLAMVHHLWRAERWNWLAEAGMEEGHPDMLAAVVFWLEHRDEITATAGGG